MIKEKIMEIAPELSEETAEKLAELCAGEFAETEDGKKASDRELCDAYERGKRDAEKSFAESELNRLIDFELKNSGAKNVKAVGALLDLDKISLKDGNLVGLDEQIAQLKKECDYLFGDEEKKPKFTSGIRSREEKIDFSRLSYKERLKLYKEAPELYKSLAGSN